MSIHALSWALNITLPTAATKVTLLTLSSYADEEGGAYPSLKTLSRQTCLSERSVRAQIIILKELGMLNIAPRMRPNGSTTSNYYTINIGDGTVKEKERTDATPVVPPPQELHPPPAGAAPHPPQELLPPPAGAAPPDTALDTPKGKKQKKQHEEKEFLMPSYINPDTWEGFLEMRRLNNKLVTPHGTKLLITALKKMHANGEDVNAIIEQSVMNSWAGFFPLKSQTNRREKFNPSEFVNRGATSRREERDERIIEHNG